MMENTKTQRRVKKVLERMIEMSTLENSYAEIFSQELEEMLNTLNFADCFGTEAQDDPRGDNREDGYSMSHVQGIDD